MFLLVGRKGNNRRSNAVFSLCTERRNFFPILNSNKTKIMITKLFNLLFIAVAFTLFSTSCNNANKAQDAEMSTNNAAPTVDNDMEPMPDAEEMPAKAATTKTAKTAKSTAKNVDVNEAQSVDVTDGNGKKVRPVPSSQPKTDADRLRRMAKDQNVNTTPQSSVPARKTVQNSNVKTPTPATETTDNRTQTQTETETPAVAGAPSHAAWDALLSQYVSSTGKVNYGGLKGAQSKLESYLTTLKNNPPASSWSRNEKMAYWINAYNAFTVKKILDNYPLGSIQELSGGKVWDDKWINIGDKTYSLNQIENGILRPTYKDARIHFAVNCAAQSCPPLHNRAFTAGNLESTLESLTKKFINNSKYNTITADKITVSKVFDWYSSDFNGVADFVNKYTDTDVSDAEVAYTEYDWSLNE